MKGRLSRNQKLNQKLRKQKRASSPLFLYICTMSNVKRDEKGRVLAGSKLNQKHSKAEILKIFEQLVVDCVEGEYLCVQECQVRSGLPRRTFYAYAEKYPELEDLKMTMNDAIIANINRQGLMNKMNPAMAIWRMKNLGERDKSEVDVQVKEQPLFDFKKKKN